MVYKAMIILVIIMLIKISTLYLIVMMISLFLLHIKVIRISLGKRLIASILVLISNSLTNV